MHKKCECIDTCPFKRILDTISKKWALLIINVLGYHERLRFNELMDVLIDISPKALSNTLKELEAEGLIKRESFDEIPPHVEYMLTNDGLEFRDAVIIPLLTWAATRNGTSGGSYTVCQRNPVHLWMY